MALIASDIGGTLRLFREAFGRYRWPLLGLTVLSFVSSILEGIGINSLIPLFSFVNKNTEGGTDAISHAIATFFSLFHIPYTLRYLLIFIILLFVIKAIVLFVVNYVAISITTHYEQNIRSRIFALTMGADWPYLSQQKVGYLDQILITDILHSAGLLSHISTSIILFTNLVMYLLIAINISFIIAFLTFVFALLLFLIFKPMFYRTRVVSDDMGKMYKNLAHYVNQNIIGIKTIKSLSVNNEIINRASDFFDHLARLKIRTTFLSGSTNALLPPIGIIFIIGIFAYFYKTTAFNFASFAIIVYAIHKVFAYVQLGQAQMHFTSSLVPYLQNTMRYHDEALTHQESTQGTFPFTFFQSLIFNDVVFSYEDSKKEVLSHVNLTIHAGTVVGLIGPSGAGKTTLVDLILRLLHPSSGHITIDGKDIHDITLKDWRTHIGYVSQDIFLMNDTIENNIKFYSPEITDEAMIEAAKMADIYDFTIAQEHGFATLVGERGIKLSGGQRQRIALARFLARRPQILILDEATSALDNESELAIQQAVADLRGKITVIIIAHRLSTIMSTDRLFVLDRGIIIEEGTPQKLLENPDSYFTKVSKLTEHFSSTD